MEKVELKLLLKDDYAAMLGAVVGVRAVLWQLVPQLAVITIFGKSKFDYVSNGYYAITLYWWCLIPYWLVH